MDLNSLVIRNENSVFCEIENQTVLLNVDAGKYHGFNEVASRIWQLIAEPIKVSQLCEVLGEEFEVTNEKCEEEVIRFLTKLNDANLISEIE